GRPARPGPGGVAAGRGRRLVGPAGSLHRRRPVVALAAPRGPGGAAALGRRRRAPAPRAARRGDPARLAGAARQGDRRADRAHGEGGRGAALARPARAAAGVSRLPGTGGAMSEEAPSGGIDPRVEEVVLAYLEAVDAGRPPDARELLAQHPE